MQRNRRLAPKEDREISAAIEEILEEEGIEVLTGTAPARVERPDGTVVLETESGRTVEGDAVLVSTGRRPHDLAQLGIAQAGIEGDSEHGIAIDEELRTSAPGVFAIGDVMGRVQHTHFATYTAGIAVANALAGEHRRYSMGRVPGAIFTDPEIASVGLTAEEAAAQGRKVKIGKEQMAKVGRARAMGETKGFIKFVVDTETDELVGMHVLAHHGAELLHEGVIAMAGTGTVAPLLDCICIHPTFSEGVKAAAANLREWRYRTRRATCPPNQDRSSRAARPSTRVSIRTSRRGRGSACRRTYEKNLLSCADVPRSVNPCSLVATSRRGCSEFSVSRSSCAVCSDMNFLPNFLPIQAD